MNLHLKKHSISRDYFVIFAVIIFTIISLSLVYTYVVYSSRQEIRNQALATESNKISREMTSTFDYVSHLMKFFGEQIIKNNPKNLEKIAELLRSNLVVDQNVRERFSWAMFDWDNTDKKMIVSTMYGVLPEAKDVSHRYYAKMAEKEPWQLHFDSADIGVSSGQWVIPAGMGIVDKQNKFIGMLSIGFSVEKFSQKIEQVLENKNISFLIFDNNNKVALHSADNNSKKFPENLNINDINKIVPKIGAGFLAKPIKNGDVRYSYFLKLDNYPYTILLGYNKAIIAQDFWDILSSGIILLSILGLIILTFILAIRRLLSKSVIQLSSVVDKIASGESIDKIDGYSSYETNNLVQQLLKINSLIKTDKENKGKLEEAIKIIRDADLEKDKFLKEMYKVLHTPLLVIKNGTDFISNVPKNKLTAEIYQEYFKMMSEAINQLLTYTTDVIYPVETDIAEIIEKSVIIQKKLASDNNLELIVNVQENIPLILADKLRLRQVLLSIIHESIAFTPPNDGKIEVSSRVEYLSNNIPAFVIITVKDNGMGLDENERKEFIAMTRKYRPEFNHAQDASTVNLNIVRHLVKLHHGSFEIITNKGIGTMFKVKLPYLKKDDLLINNNLMQFDFYKEEKIVKDEKIVDFTKFLENKRNKVVE